MESSSAYRRTDSPQRTNDSRANAEWKADPGLGNIVHGTGNIETPPNRSSKAAPLPSPDTSSEHENVIPGEGSRGVKGWTGSGKGALNGDDLGKRVKDG